MWKNPPIVDNFPMETKGFPRSFVFLPKGKSHVLPGIPPVFLHGPWQAKSCRCCPNYSWLLGLLQGFTAIQHIQVLIGGETNDADLKGFTTTCC